MKDLELKVAVTDKGVTVGASREADSMEAAGLLAVALVKTMRFAGVTKDDANTAIKAAVEKMWGNE